MIRREPKIHFLFPADHFPLLSWLAFLEQTHASSFRSPLPWRRCAKHSLGLMKSLPSGLLPARKFFIAKFRFPVRTSFCAVQSITYFQLHGSVHPSNAVSQTFGQIDIFKLSSMKLINKKWEHFILTSVHGNRSFSAGIKFIFDQWNYLFRTFFFIFTAYFMTKLLFIPIRVICELQLEWEHLHGLHNSMWQCIIQVY